VKILDSDHCVAILRGELDLGERVMPEEDLAVTSISIGELTHGAHKSRRAAENLARLDILLAVMVVLPYDETAARHFGQLKAHMETAGEIIGDLDLQIASIAIANQAPLVTHNQRHFAWLEDEGLLLEDWL
jgi:tRNA(fMet)-specific endonuclease VapC